MGLRVKPAMTVRAGNENMFLQERCLSLDKSSFRFHLMGLRVKPAMTVRAGNENMFLQERCLSLDKSSFRFHLMRLRVKHTYGNKMISRLMV